MQTFFQVAEDRKNYDKLQELVEKLSGKLKVQKKQLDDAVCPSFRSIRLLVFFQNL